MEKIPEGAKESGSKQDNLKSKLDANQQQGDFKWADLRNDMFNAVDETGNLDGFIAGIKSKPDGQIVLSSFEMQKAAVYYIIASIEKTNPNYTDSSEEFIKNAQEVKELFSLSDEMFQYAVLESLSRSLSDNRLRFSVEVQSHFNFSQEILADKEIQELVLKIIENGFIPKSEPINNPFTRPITKNSDGYEAYGIGKFFDKLGNDTAHNSSSDTLKMLEILRITFKIDDEKFRNTIIDRVKNDLIANPQTQQGEELNEFIKQYPWLKDTLELSEK